MFTRARLWFIEFLKRRVHGLYVPLQFLLFNDVAAIFNEAFKALNQGFSGDKDRVV
jgi:hypothetical protein